MRDVLSSNGDKECVPCHNDKHIPKLYSFDNMDLGPIPPALMVIFNVYLKLILTSLSVDTMCRNCHR